MSPQDKLYWQDDETLVMRAEQELSPIVLTIVPDRYHMMVNGEAVASLSDFLPAVWAARIKQCLMLNTGLIDQIVVFGHEVRARIHPSKGATKKRFEDLIRSMVFVRSLPSFEPTPRVTALLSGGLRTSSDLALARRIDIARARSLAPRKSPDGKVCSLLR